MSAFRLPADRGQTLWEVRPVRKLVVAHPWKRGAGSGGHSCSPLDWDPVGGSAVHGHNMLATLVG